MCGYIPGQSYLKEMVLATLCQAKGRPFKMDLEHCLSKSVPLKAPKSHKSRTLGRTESISLSLQIPAISGFDSYSNKNRESHSSLFPCKPSKQQWVSSCAQLSERRPLMNMSPKPGRPPTASTLLSPDPPPPRPAYFPFRVARGSVPLPPPSSSSHRLRGQLTQPPSPLLPVPVLSCTKVRVVFKHESNLSLSLSQIDTHTPHDTMNVFPACQCSSTLGFG